MLVREIIVSTRSRTLIGSHAGFESTQLARTQDPFCSWFLVFGLLCRTQLATQLRQRCIHYFFLAWYPQASIPNSADTHTGGVAVLGKPEGSPARRHFRNSCHIFVYIVVCACSRHTLDFKILLFRSFVSRKDYYVTVFLVFGLLCRHTASNSITTEMHTSGAQ